jgi:hypothetical protein
MNAASMKLAISTQHGIFENRISSIMIKVFFLQVMMSIHHLEQVVAAMGVVMVVVVMLISKIHLHLHQRILDLVQEMKTHHQL